MKRKLNEHDVPEPSTDRPSTIAHSSPSTFAHFGLDARLLQAVDRAKFASPTAVQQDAIPVILDGKDVLARSKTGSGKTLAYLLPILHSILRRKASSQAAQHTAALILVPTKELANQVASTVKSFTTFCSTVVRAENITRKEDNAVTRSRLAGLPDIVISTPSRASQWLNSEVLKLNHLSQLIIDEADLVLSYGYSSDLDNIASSLPTGIQTILISATLNTDITTLSTLLSKTRSNPTDPVVIDLSSSEAAEKSQLSHYVVSTAEEDKFLLIYAIFKLKLIKGKVIVFVADIDRCYRVKLFLEQFGIRSCVLNSELPLNSRVHVVDEFNKGVYDIIIAADEGEVLKTDGKSRKKRKTEQENGDVTNAQDQSSTEQQDKDTTELNGTSDDLQTGNKRRKNDEYTLSRGIDFHHVSCVLNFDLPISSKSYLHRVGRTARAGQTGMALSFYVPKELYRKHKPTTIPQCENDERVLTDIREEVVAGGGTDAEVKEWQFDMKKLEGFRYRFADALRSVTRIAVREARTRELRNELLASEKLKRHFEENPDDLRHLRHDNELTHGVRQRAHLRHVPEYLLPEGGKAAVAKDVGYVGLRKDGHNGIRERRKKNLAKGKGKRGGRKSADPIKSLNMTGRGKK